MGFNQEQASFKEFLEYFDSSHVIPYIGAGFSMPACQEWSKFLQSYFDSIKEDWISDEQETQYNILKTSNEFNKDELLADLLISFGTPLQFRKALDRLIDVELPNSMKTKYQALHQAFPYLKITTNYDRLIERSSNSELNPPNTCFGNNPKQLEYLLTNLDKNNTLLKIHGCTTIEKSVVLSHSQYEEMYGANNDKKLPQFLRRVYQNNCLLFIGCSLYKDRPLRILEEVNSKGNPKQHFAIMRKPSTRVGRVEINQRLGKLNISTIWIDDFNQIEEILDILQSRKISISEVKEDIDNYLLSIEKEVYRENSKGAFLLIEERKEFILKNGSKQNQLHLKILQNKALQIEERYDEAKELLYQCLEAYSKDYRPYLYLAEMHLLNNEFDENLELLNKAASINNDNWFFHYNTINRAHTLNEIDKDNDFEISLLSYEKRVQSTFYTLYSSIYDKRGDFRQALNCIETAIHLTPYKINNYAKRIDLLKHYASSESDYERILNELQYFYGKMNRWNSNSINLRLWYLLSRIGVYIQLKRLDKIHELLPQTLPLFLQSNFSPTLDDYLHFILCYVCLEKEQILKLLNHISRFEHKPSQRLTVILLEQLLHRDAQLEGIEFFHKTGNTRIFRLLTALKENNTEEFISEIRNDEILITIFGQHLKGFLELREILVSIVPDKSPYKIFIQLFLQYDHKKYLAAFQTLTSFDYMQLGIYHCQHMVLEIFHRCNAWEYMVEVIEKIQPYIYSEEESFTLSQKLFLAYYMLEDYQNVIKTGNSIIKLYENSPFLPDSQLELLFSDLFQAYILIGRLDHNVLNEARELIEQHDTSKFSYDFRVKFEFTLYFELKDYQKSHDVIMDAIYQKGNLTEREYADLQLFFLLRLEPYLQFDINFSSKKEITDGDYVKFSETWYYIGDKSPHMQAPFQLNSNSQLYSSLIGKKLHDNIKFQETPYSPLLEGKIEVICSINDYIYWNIIHNFKKLTKSNSIPNYRAFTVIDESGNPNIDAFKHIIKIVKGSNVFFNAFIENNYPFSALAVNQNGLGQAASLIAKEQQGFITFCAGDIEAFQNQKEVARRIIVEEQNFVVDGTSALFLSESNLLNKIISYLPNLSVPQAVITFLTELGTHLSPSINRSGSIDLVNGNLNFTQYNQAQMNKAKETIIGSIKVLNKQDILYTSKASKYSCFTEQDVPPECSDACFQAKKRGIPILTDDLFHLQINHIETKKPQPTHFSSIALIRVLYEKDILTFDEYINFFSYLSHYRLRFLYIDSTDLYKVVFGDQKIQLFRPKDLGKLNFSLLFSEEYGYTTEYILYMLSEFLCNVVVDNTITDKNSEEVFLEILSLLPENFEKRETGEKLISYVYVFYAKTKSPYLQLIQTRLYTLKSVN